VSRKNNNGPIWSVCRACVGLVAAWWRIDRVRISPREGELLRLRPECVLIIAGKPVEVLRRQEVETSCAQGVRYECRTDEGTAQLEVRKSENANRLEISWLFSGRIEALQEHQIEVFGYDEHVLL
jgi:hypothetical protein